MPDTTDLFPLHVQVLSRQIDVWIDRFDLKLSEAFLCPFDLGGEKEKLDLEMFKQAFHDHGYRQPCYSIVLVSESKFPERFMDRIDQINYGDLFDRFFLDVYRQPQGNDWISDWFVSPVNDINELPYSVKWGSRFKVNLLNSAPILTGKQIDHEYEIIENDDGEARIKFQDETCSFEGVHAYFLLQIITHQGKELSAQSFSRFVETSKAEYYDLDPNDNRKNMKVRRKNQGKTIIEKITLIQAQISEYNEKIKKAMDARDRETAKDYTIQRDKLIKQLGRLEYNDDEDKDVNNEDQRLINAIKGQRRFVIDKMKEKNANKMRAHFHKCIRAGVVTCYNPKLDILDISWVIKRSNK
jgi:hypothetical protein